MKSTYTLTCTACKRTVVQVAESASRARFLVEKCPKCGWKIFNVSPSA